MISYPPEARAIPELREISRFRLAASELNLTPERVYRALGYDDEVPEVVPPLVEEVLEEAPQRLNVQAGFLVVPPEETALSEQGIVLRGVAFETGDLIAGLLAGSEAMAVFATTAGAAFDVWARELLAEDPMKWCIADALGSVAAERAVDAVEDRLIDVATALDWGATRSYGPGYCGWHVSEQHKVFGLLPPAFLGITLSESALMRPVKSVSGVIGLGPHAQPRAHGCEVCTLVTCFRRRAPASSS